MKIIERYLLREVLGLFALALFIITVLFMSQRVIQLTEWAVNQGVGPGNIARLMVYLLPTVLIVIIPIVTLFAILLAVGRLSADQEIVALKASGISLYRLFPPVLTFAALALALGLLTSWVLVPAAALASRTLHFRIVRTQTEAAVQPRTFIKLLEQTTFYVRDKKSDGEMLGLMAAVENWPEGATWVSRQIAFARSGRFVHDPVRLVNELWLNDGILVREDRPTGREDFAAFTTCRISLELGRTKAKVDERRQEMDLFAMREEMAGLARLTGKERTRAAEEARKLALQWHERFAFPFGCLALCFWAVPLGIQPPRAGRARAIVVSVLLSGLFYYLMILAKFGALKGWGPPAAMLWLPDLMIFVTGMYMLRQKNLERPILLLSRLEDAIYYLAERVQAWRQQRRQQP